MLPDNQAQALRAHLRLIGMNKRYAYLRDTSQHKSAAVDMFDRLDDVLVDRTETPHSHVIATIPSMMRELSFARSFGQGVGHITKRMKPFLQHYTAFVDVHADAIRTVQDEQIALGTAYFLHDLLSAPLDLDRHSPASSKAYVDMVVQHPHLWLKDTKAYSFDILRDAMVEMTLLDLGPMHVKDDRVDMTVDGSKASIIQYLDDGKKMTQKHEMIGGQLRLLTSYKRNSAKPQNKL